MKRCKRCKEEIANDASLCYHCGSSQRGVASIFPNPIEKGSLIVSIIVLILSIIQYFDTKGDKAKAEEALAKANKYEAETKIILTQVDSLRMLAKEYQLQALQTSMRVEQVKGEIDTASSQMNNIILSTLRNDWLQANNSFFAMNPNAPEAVRFVNNINTIVVSILKDSTKVKVWWNETGAQLNRKYHQQ